MKEFDKTYQDSCPLASWPTGHPAPEHVPNCDEVNVCGTGVTGGMFLRITQNGELWYSLASASAVLEQMQTMMGSSMLTRRRRARAPLHPVVPMTFFNDAVRVVLKFVSSDTLHCWI